MIIRDRWTQAVVGFTLVLAACIILYDCFDKRGKKMPWPLSGLMPW